jgi:hypothetical protein
MTLSDLAAVGSFSSGVAVVFSFIFLALQMRQSNKNQRAMMQQGRAARTSETMLRVAEPHMIEAMMRGGQGDVTMSPVQIETFVRAAISMFVNWEDTFLQHSAGTIDASGMASDAAMMRIIFSIPGYRAAWTTTQRQFGPRFRDYVDTMMLEQKSRPPRRDVSTAWKAHALEELAQAQVATAVA